MTPALAADRKLAVDQMSVDLVHRASLLTRLIYRRTEVQMSRSEITILATLRDGPQRITSLAELEGLAQPTVTQLVQRLEQRGLVARERADDDGRVVLVTLTVDGERAVDEIRERCTPVMTAALSQLSDEEFEALQAATVAVGKLVEALQNDEQS